MLIYLHIAFIRTPINCLDEVKNEWPRDGILRVEILYDQSQSDAQLDGVDEVADEVLGPELIAASESTELEERG